MTGRDLNEIYDLYAALGGDRPVMQEGTLLFAQIVASRASGYPVEAIMDLKAKDSAYLKTGYTVFLSHGISCAADIQQLNQVYIAAGRYTKAGPQFFMTFRCGRPLP